MAIIQTIGKPGAGMSAPLWAVRSPLDGGVSSLAAPASLGNPPPTPPAARRRGSNRLQWLQIQLFLEDLPKRPGPSA